MRPGERREQVLSIVRKREQVSVEVLAKETTASPETIRRDLTELAAKGLLRKIHGGAATPNVIALNSNGEGSFQARMRFNIQEKRSIARCAASLFAPGDTIFIDTGTTTVVFAEEIAKLSSLMVVTNSSVIAQQIAQGGKDNRVILIGGEYRPEAAENLGLLAIEQISRFRCNHAVLTVGAVDTLGATDYDLQEAEIAIAMVRNSQQVTVLADSSKMGRAGLFTVCPLSEIDRLVSDRGPDGLIHEAMVSSSVQMFVADLAEQDIAMPFKSQSSPSNA